MEISDFLKNSKIIPEDELKKQIKIAQKSNGIKAEEAKTIIYNHCIKMIVKEAISFNKSFSIEVEELIQEGSIALMRSIKYFDVKKNVKFTTYFGYLLKQKLISYCYQNASIIQVSKDKSKRVIAANKAYYDLINSGEDPTVEKIAKMTKLKPKEITYYLEHPLYSIVSLDMTIENDDLKEVSSLANMIPSKQNIEEEQDIRNLNEDLKKVLDILPERDRLIVDRKFGLSDGIERTFDEIRKELNWNVSRQRVQQVYDKALKKLKNSAQAYNLGLNSYLK